MITVDPVPFLDLARANGELQGEFDDAWRRVVDGTCFVGGREVADFETLFAEFCDVDHCVGVANGTDALELVLDGLGIGAGDEVIVPANTFVATVEAVCRVGARPRFVDVSPDTLLVDPAAVRAAVNRCTAAVIGVHLFGQMFDVAAVEEITRSNDLALIEDAAQAHGARMDGRRAGSVGVAAAFSFYPGKNLGAFGDGGAVVTRDPGLAETVRRTADHGRARADRHRHDRIGRNSRLDALQAAVLRIKLRDLDAANRRRADAVALYSSELPDHAVLVGTHPSAEPVHHLVVVRVDDRERVTAALDAARVGWGVHYPVPCHLQPAFARYADAPLPVAEAAAGRILSLPVFPEITKDEIRRVCDVLRSVTPC